MRLIVPALSLLSMLACATTGTVGPTRYVDVSNSVAFAAALEAAHAIGARIRTSSEFSGMIAAEMTGGEVGPGIVLNISVSSMMQGSEVQVSASEPGAGEVDPYRKEELRQLERDYLDLVEQAVLGMRARRGRRY